MIRGFKTLKAVPRPTLCVNQLLQPAYVEAASTHSTELHDFQTQSAILAISGLVPTQSCCNSNAM